MDRAALDAALIAAHAAGDEGSLVALYTTAAEQAEAAGDTNAFCFFLTHAYVFALASGKGDADSLRSRLVAAGRDE